MDCPVIGDKDVHFTRHIHLLGGQRGGDDVIQQSFQPLGHVHFRFKDNLMIHAYPRLTSRTSVRPMSQSTDTS